MNRREAIARIAALMGGTLSAPTLSALLRYVPGGDGAALPSVFDEREKELLAVIVDHIIPATDTPGAKAVGVADFIDRLVTESYLEDERQHFMAGLGRVDAVAQRAYDAAFLSLAPAQQVTVLAGLDRVAYRDAPTLAEVAAEENILEKLQGPGEDPLEGAVDEDTASASEQTRPPFFRSMKELTLVGYYTSEVGATQELRHEPVPGRYDGCVPYAEIGRAWAV